MNLEQTILKKIDEAESRLKNGTWDELVHSTRVIKGLIDLYLLVTETEEQMKVVSRMTELLEALAEELQRRSRIAKLSEGVHA